MTQSWERPTSLEAIPGMAKCGLDALKQAGISKLSDLKGKDPVDLYIEKRDAVDSDLKKPLFNALLMGCVYANLEGSPPTDLTFTNLMTVPNMYEVAAYALMKSGFSLSNVGPANRMFEQAFKEVYLGPRDWILVYYSMLILAGFKPEGERPGPWTPAGTN